MTIKELKEILGNYNDTTIVRIKRWSTDYRGDIIDRQDEVDAVEFQSSLDDGKYIVHQPVKH